MNFLFNDHKLVFIHLTKNAGSSVRAAFSGPHTGPVPGEIPDEWKHLPSFTVIRNPFDRFLSAVNMFRFGTENVGSDDYYSKPRIPDLTPSSALDILENREIPFDRSARYTEANLKHHLWPQTDPFNCIQFAKVKLRQENLEKEFAEFVSHLGLKVTLPTVRSAKATRPIFRKNDLSPSEVSRIRHIFKDDFMLLGYLDEPSTGYGSDEKLSKELFLDSERSIRNEWPQYFQISFVESQGANLPDPKCNLDGFANSLIYGKQTKVWAGRSKNIIEHFRQLEPEFGGKKRISHLLACVIVALRRDPSSATANALFQRITDDFGQMIAEDMNSRWLTSVCDTFVDVAQNDLERTLGLTGTLFANTMKLVETKIKAFHPKRPWPPSERTGSPATLYDGVIPFWIEGGDAIDNLFGRIERSLKVKSPAAPFVQEIINRAIENDTALSKMMSFAGNKNPPLADRGKIAKLKNILDTL